MSTMTRAWVLAAMILAAALVMVACSSGGGTGPGPAGGGADMSVAPDMALKIYPEGPYGNHEGDTLVDVFAEGYRFTVDKTTVAQVTWDTNIRLNDFYNNPACKCLLITIGATWCTACQEEQPAIIADVVSDPNFCVLGILQEGPTGATATRDDVDNWSAEYSQNFPVVQGNAKTNKLMSGFGSTIGLPFSFIVTPSDMKVQQVIQGFDPNVHDSAKILCNY